MIGKHRPHFDRAAEIELHVVHLLEGQVRRHLIQADGEKSGLHLLEKRAAQTMHRAFVTEDADVYFRVIGGHEKGKALDVIPMGVT